MGLLAFVVATSTVAASPGAAPRYFEPVAWSVPEGATPAEAERSRIRQHLAAVEATLREETPAGLTDGQRAARLRAMDALHAYWTRGEFPRNHDAPRRTPVFIDAEGTPCAMGYLLIASGADALAREIATYENNDFVADIGHPRLSAWLDANGLSAEEAGWIQPSYDACGFGFIGGGGVCGADGRTYECAGAAECAGVEVVSEGACGAGTTTGTGTGSGTTGGVVQADDVCPEESTGMDSMDDDGPDTVGTDSTTVAGSSSSSAGSDTTTSDAMTSSTSGAGSTSGAAAEALPSRGCRIADGTPLWAGLMLLLGLCRRRVERDGSKARTRGAKSARRRAP